MAGHLPGDVRMAFRGLSRNPLFAGVAALTLAIGMTAIMLVAIVANEFFLRPVRGVVEPGELVEVDALVQGEVVQGGISAPDFHDIEVAGTPFASFAAHAGFSVTVNAGEAARVTTAALVSAGYFRTLGVKPAKGRFFTVAEEASGEGLIVLSDHAWRTWLGGDPDVLGKRVRVNGQTMTVIGVTEPGFRGPYKVLSEDAFLPLGVVSSVVRGLDPESRDVVWLQLIGRLSAGGSPEAATTALKPAAAGLVAAHPETNDGLSFAVRPYAPLWRGLGKTVAGPLMIVAAVALLVLLVAAANVGNLMLARAFAREQECALRLALGARRSAVVRMLVMESLVIAAMGATMALVIASWSTGLLAVLGPIQPVPLALDFGVDARILAFVVGLAFVTGMVAGTLPAIRAAKPPAARLLRRAEGGDRYRSRLRGALVVVQIALSLVVVVWAALFVRTLDHAAHMDRGFSDRDVYVAPEATLQGGAGTIAEAGDELLRMGEEVGSLPGVESAALTWRAPLAVSGLPFTNIGVPDARAEADRAGLRTDFTGVTANYFGILGIPVVAGRSFATSDDGSSPRVAVVSAALARRLWGDEPAVGREVRRGGRALTVIGIVADAHQRRLDREPGPVLYLPFAQSPSSRVDILVRMQPGRPSPVAAIRELGRRLVPDMPALETVPLRQYSDGVLLPQRVAGFLAGALGLTCLVLACVGLYGVVAFSIQQRTREIGIRVAVGATRGSILSLVGKEAFRLSIIGIVAGVLLSVPASGLAAALVFGVRPGDPIVPGGVGAIFLVVTLFATYLGAWRALRIDPVRAMKPE